jgi:hypothetical protein
MRFDVYSSLAHLNPAMHRTQIYLQDDLHQRLKLQARSAGISMSELIRQTLEKGIDQDPVARARAFFDSFEPLESFKNVDAEGYVRELRNRSRILRAEELE